MGNVRRPFDRDLKAEPWTLSTTNGHVSVEFPVTILDRPRSRTIHGTIQGGGG